MTAKPSTPPARPKMPSLDVTSRAQQEADEGPKNGTVYFGIDKPCVISMTAGKA
jgi:hypothetical protein